MFLAFLPLLLVPIAIWPQIASSPKILILQDFAGNLLSGESVSTLGLSGIDTLVSGRLSILNAAFISLAESKLFNLVFIGFGAGWSIDSVSLITSEPFSFYSLHSSFLDVVFRFGVLPSFLALLVLGHHLVKLHHKVYSPNASIDTRFIFRALLLFTLFALAADLFISVPIYWIILGVSFSMLKERKCAI